MEHGIASSIQRRSKVLVVEDDDAAAKSFARALEYTECRCASTGTGREAIELMGQQRFDLLVIDKNLPDISGIEVARKARSSVPPVPVVVVSAYPTEETRHEAETIGVSCYLQKPFDLYEFRRVVSSALQPFDCNRESPSSGERPTVRPPRRHVAIRSEDRLLSMLVIEPNEQIRARLAEGLAATGYSVTAFQSVQQARAHACHVGYGILVARLETLRETRDWKDIVHNGPPLGTIAIATSMALSERVEATELGAMGVLTPPYSRTTIDNEVQDTIARIRTCSEMP